jgi:hypothetical protein
VESETFTSVRRKHKLTRSQPAGPWRLLSENDKLRTKLITVATVSPSSRLYQSLCRTTRTNCQAPLCKARGSRKLIHYQFINHTIDTTVVA